MFLALAVLESVLTSGYLLGLIHGGLIVGVPALVLVFFMTHTGAIWQLAGCIGEDNTRDELRKAKRRRLIWGGWTALRSRAAMWTTLSWRPAAPWRWTASSMPLRSTQRCCGVTSSRPNAPPRSRVQSCGR